MGIRILKGGMMTTVQDLGRYGYQSQGCPFIQNSQSSSG